MASTHHVPAALCSNTFIIMLSIIQTELNRSQLERWTFGKCQICLRVIMAAD